MAEKTLYIVLRRNGDSESWCNAGPHQTAHSAEQAIRQTAELLVENELDPAGDYVAIPSRSWQPTTVAAEVQTKIRLGGA